MIDLKQFCSTEESRPYLHNPFSRGEYTFATNGHVLVRVPRLEGIAEQEKPAAEKTFSDSYRDGPRGSLIADISLPEKKQTECETCDGRGTEHDCPDCNCRCDLCEGKGVIDVTTRLYVQIGETYFDGKYISQLMKLPGMRFEAQPAPKRPASFTFDGGDGVLMPVMYITTGDNVVPGTIAI
jgi:hypothetical protein